MRKQITAPIPYSPATDAALERLKSVLSPLVGVMGEEEYEMSSDAIAAQQLILSAIKMINNAEPALFSDPYKRAGIILAAIVLDPKFVHLINAEIGNQYMLLLNRHDIVTDLDSLGAFIGKIDQTQPNPLPLDRRLLEPISDIFPNDEERVKAIYLEIAKNLKSREERKLF